MNVNSCWPPGLSSCMRDLFLLSGQALEFSWPKQRENSDVRLALVKSAHADVHCFHLSATPAANTDNGFLWQHRSKYRARLEGGVDAENEHIAPAPAPTFPCQIQP